MLLEESFIRCLCSSQSALTLEIMTHSVNPMWCSYKNFQSFVSRSAGSQFLNLKDSLSANQVCMNPKELRCSYFYTSGTRLIFSTCPLCLFSWEMCKHWTKHVWYSHLVPVCVCGYVLGGWLLLTQLGRTALSCSLPLSACLLPTPTPVKWGHPTGAHKFSNFLSFLTIS